MLVPDGTVSASDGAFDVSKGSVDPLERGGQSDLAARSSDDRLMDAPGVADTGETVLAELKLRFAKAVISARRKPVTRRNFKRIGLPSGVVSTAATIGVLPGEPRPRLPPFRSPPR